MKKKCINALLLGMAICTASPSFLVMAEETAQEEAAQEDTDAAEAEDESDEDDSEEEAEDSTEEETEEGEDESAYTDLVPSLLAEITSENFGEDAAPLLSFLNDIEAAVGMPESLTGYINYVFSTYEPVEEGNMYSLSVVFHNVFAEDFPDEIMSTFMDYYLTRCDEVGAGDEVKVMIQAASDVDDLFIVVGSYYDALYPAASADEEAGISVASEEYEESAEDGILTVASGEESSSDSALATAIADAQAELDAIDISALSAEGQVSAMEIIEDAKASFANCSSTSELSAIRTLTITTATNKIQKLITEEALANAQSVALSSLEQYYASLTFPTSATAEKAASIYEVYVERIQSAADTTSVDSSLAEAKSQLEALAADEESAVEELRNEVAASITETANTISSDSSIVDGVVALINNNLASASSSEEVMTVQTVGNEILSSLKSALEEQSASAAASTLNSLKALTSDSDLSELLDYLTSKAAAADAEDALEILQTGVELMSLDGWSAYSDLLVSKLNSYSSSFSNQEEAATIISEAQSAMSGQTVLTIYQAYESAIVSLDALAESDDLSDDRAAAEDTLDALLADISDSSLLESAQEIVNSAKESVKAAASASEINAIITSATNDINSLASGTGEDTELESMRTYVSEQISAAVSSAADSGLQSIISVYANTALTQLESAETSEEMTSILSEFNNYVATATADYEADAELASEKADAISKLSSMISSLTISDECASIISTAKSDIQAATTVSDVEDIYDTAVANFNTAYASYLQETYTEKLNALLDDVSDESTLEQIQEIVDKAVSNILSTTSESAMESIYQQAVVNVGNITGTSDTTDPTPTPSAESTATPIPTEAASANTNATATPVPTTSAEETATPTPTEAASDTSLEDAKAAAITELENYTDLDTSAVEKVIATYTNKINSATTVDEVESYLEEGKELLQKLVDAAAESDEDSDSTSSTSSTTTTPTPTESAEDATSKEGESDAASATGSTGGTSTTEEASSVKTGDENGSAIAAAVAAIVICLGAVGGVVYSQFRKKKNTGKKDGKNTKI